MPFVRYKNVQMQIATAYEEKKSGIPFTVRGRTPRLRRKTKDANFLVSIWLLNQDVMACRIWMGCFIAVQTFLGSCLTDQSCMPNPLNK